MDYTLPESTTKIAACGKKNLKAKFGEKMSVW
jgi:hypothetical protein